MMMVLGLFVFQLRTVPYQQLQYQRNWRHVTNNRVNRRPTTQFLGPDNDQLTLSGVLMPEVTGGRLSLFSRSAVSMRVRTTDRLRRCGSACGVVSFIRIGFPCSGIGTTALRVRVLSALARCRFRAAGLPKAYQR